MYTGIFYTPLTTIFFTFKRSLTMFFREGQQPGRVQSDTI